MSALDVQVGGDHYRAGGIQPVQYIEANGLKFLEGSVVKRVTRHDRPTGKGRQDIEKAIHELQLLLELRYPLPLVEPAAAIDDESPRAMAIGQNGPSGEHYDETLVWPEGMNWYAVDADGRGWFYEYRPKAHLNSWERDDGGATQVRPSGGPREPCAAWFGSLVKRPD